MMDKIFDPHLHFFALEQGNYSWLKSENGPTWPNIASLRRDFEPTDLQLTNYQLAGFCHIEAGFDNNKPERELCFLTALSPPVECAVSYIPIDLPASQFTARLTALRDYKSLIGVRDITEGDDAARLCNQHVATNLMQLGDYNLLFEAQFELENNLASAQLIKLAKQLPNLTIVLNHAGLPSPSSFSAWQQNLMQLAQCENVFVKFSGFEMLNELPKSFELTVLNALLNHFGEHRVMFASNFPICLMAMSYETRWDAYKALCTTKSQWQALSYSNACKVYAAK